jgi:hypothetical protein
LQRLSLEGQSSGLPDQAAFDFRQVSTDLSLIGADQITETTRRTRPAVDVLK